MAIIKPFLHVLFITLLGSVLEQNNAALGQALPKKLAGFGNYLENSVLCLDKSIRYRKRPMSLVKVRTQLAIIAVFSLSSIDMDLTADLYLYQSWRDSRYKGIKRSRIPAISVNWYYTVCSLLGAGSAVSPARAPCSPCTPGRAAR